MTSKFIPRVIPKSGTAGYSAPAPEFVPPFKVVICIPAGDTMCTGTAFDLANLVGFTVASMPNLDLRITVAKSSILPSSRQLLAKGALGWPGVTHTLWLDSDMRFPKDALVRLLSHKKDIVGVNYCTRGEPYEPVAYLFPLDEHKKLYTEHDSTGLVETPAMGFGLVLIDVDVFRAMDKPYFMLGYSPESENFNGEDVFFAERAAEAGFKLWIDQDLSKEIRHLGQYEFGHAEAATQREQIEDYKESLVS